MNSSVDFVLAQERDAETIARLRQKIWATTYRGIYPDEMIDHFDLTWHAEKDRQRIQSAAFSVYLLQIGETPIGYLILRTADPATLMSLYVLSDYQKQGIGAQAMAFAKKCFQAANVESFLCHCQPDNANALAFYHRMGGKIVDQDMENPESWQNSVIFQFGGCQ